MTDSLDAGMPAPESALPQERDRLYAKRFWENPKHTDKDFVQMITSITSSAKVGSLEIETNPRSEIGKQLLSAYRRMGQAIGLQIGQFVFDPETQKSKADIGEGDDRLKEVGDAKRDREYALKFLSSHNNISPYFKGMLDSLRGNIQNGDEATYQFISTTNLEQDDKEKLSFRRVLYRSIGYKVGPYSLAMDAGTARATVKE